MMNGVCMRACVYVLCVRKGEGCEERVGEVGRETGELRCRAQQASLYLVYIC